MHACRTKHCCFAWRGRLRTDAGCGSTWRCHGIVCVGSHEHPCMHVLPKAGGGPLMDTGSALPLLRKRRCGAAAPLCSSLQMHGNSLECSSAGLAAEFVEYVHMLVVSVCRQSSIALRCVELHTQSRERSIGCRRLAMCRADGDEACELWCDVCSLGKALPETAASCNKRLAPRRRCGLAAALMLSSGVVEIPVQFCQLVTFIGCR